MRKTYTVSEKIKILKKIEKGTVGKSIRAVSKQHGIDESVVRGWYNKKEKLFGLVGDLSCNIRVVRQLPGAGRKALFPLLEKELSEWVAERNNLGLRVKDRLIESFALKLRERYLDEFRASDNIDHYNIAQLERFQASHSWCCAFKRRYGLVRRRHTTTRSLPYDFAAVARTFISQVHQLISEKGIELKNIHNFDQVPRYFELDKSSTIAKKGTREVLLKKGSSTHRRFTFTPCISAGGKFTGVHCLFSKLSKKPRGTAKGVTVDVNRTGMWNERCIQEVIDNVIIKIGRGASLAPTLIVLDSYGSHKKFVEAYYEHYLMLPSIEASNSSSHENFLRNASLVEDLEDPNQTSLLRYIR